MVAPVEITSYIPPKVSAVQRVKTLTTVQSMLDFHFRKTLMIALTVAVAELAAISATAHAVEHTKPTAALLPPTALTPGSTRADEKAQMKTAAAKYTQAKRACDKLSDVPKRTCRKDARAQHRAAVAAGVATSAVPALQTQSSSVNATGVAPSTIGPDATPARSSTTGR
jgi:hypothetical protein